LSRSVLPDVRGRTPSESASLRVRYQLRSGTVGGWPKRGPSRLFPELIDVPNVAVGSRIQRSKDEALAIEAEEVQHRYGDDPADCRARIRKAVERRYTTLT
jgi:hypothetical protein